MKIANILSIAGSDPSGGAGIQADLKSISANGGYGMTAIVALTAQNTCGVQAVEMVSTEFVRSQLKTIADDIEVNAIKIGMLGTAEMIDCVAESLAWFPNTPVVLDPVCVAKGGDRLLQSNALEQLRTTLLPKVDIITPNLPEAAEILGSKEPHSNGDMEKAAAELVKLGANAVLLKGGHQQGDSCDDLLYDGKQFQWFGGNRIRTKNTHGTGCSLSSAIASQIPQTDSLVEAVFAAKTFITGAITHADQLNVGHGHGPICHFYRQWF